MRYMYTVVTKEWRDRANGQSYCAVRIINNETGESKSLPYTYGYGNYGEQLARAWIQSQNPEISFQFLREIAYCVKIEGCTKKEIKSWGEK